VIRGLVITFFGVAAVPLLAQDLEPRAYSPSPVGVNIVVVSNTFNKGDMNFDPSLAVEDAKASINASVLTYVRTLNVGGRSANIAYSLPYAVGDISGKLQGIFQSVHRSGLADSLGRFSINLYGAPAMDLKKFGAYQQKTIIGASLAFQAPSGQYDPAKLINIGNHRWAFRPQIGVSRAWGKWIFEVDGSAFFFATNHNFYGGKTREQNPIGAVQFHTVYNFKRGMWAAFDANFYYGGRTTVNDVRNFDLQRNSRLGATYSLPVNRKMSMKVAYSSGAVTSIGGDFRSLSVAFQYLWGAGL
jgi:hypothetical protein